MPLYNAILIPGGGLLEDGSLPPWTQARLELALQYDQETQWIGLLSGGTVHKPPPLDQKGFPFHESRVLAAALVSRGFAPERILTEICSYDTIGNAYFSRMLFSEPLKLSGLLVITSKFHMPRTKDIFQWVYSLLPRPIDFRLDFIPSEDNGLSENALAARITREKESLEAFQETKKKIANLADFHRWLYAEHKAYAPTRPPDLLSAEELKSY